MRSRPRASGRASVVVVGAFFRRVHAPTRWLPRQYFWAHHEPPATARATRAHDASAAAPYLDISSPKRSMSVESSTKDLTFASFMNSAGRGAVNARGAPARPARPARPLTVVRQAVRVLRLELLHEVLHRQLHRLVVVRLAHGRQLALVDLAQLGARDDACGRGRC